MPRHFLFQQPPSKPLVVQHEPQMGHEDHQARAVPAVTEASVDAAKLAQQRERAEVARVIGRPILDDGTIVTALPDYYVSDDGVDITRCCDRHEWASLPYIVGPGRALPVCEHCEAERLFFDGYARYRDLLAKRRDGVV